MESVDPSSCRHCGKPMKLFVRISLPRQMVYRCDSCKAQAWTPDQTGRISVRNNKPQKKDGE
jgi:DNA-directed RNA polymerase subunit RPC12/RpoP